jgi:hypothetical protein
MIFMKVNFHAASLADEDAAPDRRMAFAAHARPTRTNGDSSAPRNTMMAGEG